MGREGDNRKLNDLVQRLRGVTEKPTPKLRSIVGINPRYEGISIWSEKILNNPDGPAAADALEAQAKRIEELQNAFREIYEVYAGSEGFIPETCAEGYQQQLIKEMAEIAAKYMRIRYGE